MAEQPEVLAAPGRPPGAARGGRARRCAPTRSRDGAGRPRLLRPRRDLRPLPARAGDAAPRRAGRAEPRDALRRAAGLRRLPRRGHEPVRPHARDRDGHVAAGRDGRPHARRHQRGRQPAGARRRRRVDLGAGEERAVPATKTFTAQALAFALLADALGPAGVGPATGRACPAPSPRCSATPPPPSGWPRPSATPRGSSPSRAAAAPGRARGGAEAQGDRAAPGRGLQRGRPPPRPDRRRLGRLPVLAFSAAGPAAADVADLVAALRERGAPCTSSPTGPTSPCPTRRPARAAGGDRRRGPGAAGRARAGPAARPRPRRAPRPVQGHPTA